MKIKGLLLGMFACAALASCTNNDLVESDNGVSANGKNETFVKVNLSLANSSTSRALVEDAKAGETYEFSVKDVYFAFYSADGTFLGFDEKNDWQPKEGTDGNVTASTTITLKSDTKPFSVVAIVNAPAEFKGKSLSELNSAVNNIDPANLQIDESGTSASFVMTNSTYLNGQGTVINAVEISEGALTSDKEAVETTSGINIFVERLASKVTVVNDPSLPDLSGIEGLTTGFKFKINGWGLNGTNKSTYPLKKIDQTWSFGSIAWNSPTNNRSYWAEDPNYNETTSTDNFNFISWNATNKLSAAHDYCLENTMDGSLLGMGKSIAYTHVLIAAQILKDNDEAVDLYRYKTIYYEKGDFINLVLSTIKGVFGYRIKDGDKYRDLTDKDVIIANDKEVATVKLNDGVTLYKYNDGNGAWPATVDEEKVSEVSIEDIKKMEEYYGSATYFNGGRCYYYVPIKHFAELYPAAIDENTEYTTGAVGVVRNHWYNLTIKSISKIGEAVYDPEASIIPQDTPDKEWFVSAKLNILGWQKMPNQDVNL